MLLARAPLRRALALLLLCFAQHTEHGVVGTRGVAAKVVQRADAPASPPTYAQYQNYTVAELQAATSNKARRTLLRTPTPSARRSPQRNSVTTSSSRLRSFSTAPR